jgi:hypothetical protein
MLHVMKCQHLVKLSKKCKGNIMKLRSGKVINESLEELQEKLKVLEEKIAAQQMASDYTSADSRYGGIIPGFVQNDALEKFLEEKSAIEAAIEALKISAPTFR